MDAARSPFEIVVIGASWGGLAAITRVVTSVPADFPSAVAIVQHRSHHESSLTTLLDRTTAWPVHEAEDKEPVRPGTFFVAPPGYHLLVDSGAFALSTDEPVGFSRPSIDVLFESAADAYHERVIAVVLTGANDDGALGAQRIRARGGYVIVQDPATAVRREMPAATIAACDPDAVLPLEVIASRLVDLCQHNEHAERA